MRDRATDYARSVVNGEVVAGLPHIQACRRHLRDLERQNTADFPYLWDAAKANRVLEFAETLTIAEGTAPQPVHLMDFQCFDIGVLFGWYNKQGYRRFRRAYKSVARQNGKTFENGIKAAYIAAFGGYHYGKLFTAATKHRQAKIAWSEVAKFIGIDKDLSAYFKVQEYIALITALNTNCTIEALSKDGSLDEGFRSIFSSIDEIHQHRDNSIYKAIYNGTKALAETLVSMITTRGNSLNSFCYEMDSLCLQILAGTFVAEDFFVDIYTLDKGDDPFDEKNWIKANPYLARTEEGLKTLRTDAETAKKMGGSDLRDFLIKALNTWVQASDNQYVDVEKFKLCAKNKGLEAMRGRACYVGLDLSSGGDLTSLALDFEQDSGKDYYYSHSFLPRGRFEEHIKTDLAPYDIWEQQELITVTGGESDFKNDYKFIIKQLHDLQEQYGLKYLGIGYDPHNADGILADLEEFGCPLLMILQSAKFLNDATEDLRLAIKSEGIEYDEQNGLMSWSFVNAKLVKNSFGEMKVDKEPRARHKRIDPVDACIDAHAIKMKLESSPAIDIESEMEKYLKLMGFKK